MRAMSALVWLSVFGRACSSGDSAPRSPPASLASYTRGLRDHHLVGAELSRPRTGDPMLAVTTLPAPSARRRLSALAAPRRARGQGARRRSGLLLVPSVSGHEHRRHRRATTSLSRGGSEALGERTISSRRAGALASLSTEVVKVGISTAPLAPCDAWRSACFGAALEAAPRLPARHSGRGRPVLKLAPRTAASRDSDRAMNTAPAGASRIA